MTGFNTKKKHPNVTGSFFEQVKDFGSPALSATKKDLATKTAEAVLEQVFGAFPKGELKEGQILDLTKEKKESKPSFFEIKSQETLLFVKEQEITQEVEAARSELQKAAEALKKLGQDVIEVQKAAEKMPTKPGVYHLAFFERLKQIIRFFRERIEESRTWLGLMISKKRQKKYWAMYKKHGTKFGLSGERTVATQAG